MVCSESHSIYPQAHPYAVNSRNYKGDLSGDLRWMPIGSKKVGKEGKSVQNRNTVTCSKNKTHTHREMIIAFCC